MSSLQVEVHTTLGHFLDAGIFVRTSPLPDDHIVFELAMLSRTILQLAHEVNVQLRTEIPDDREPHRIALALLRQPRTDRRVTQVALYEFLVRRLSAFVAGRATITIPCPTKWEPDRMKKAAVVDQLRHRHEEWTSQGGEILFFGMMGHCTQGVGSTLESIQLPDKWLLRNSPDL
jgi:hypothetical protein